MQEEFPEIPTNSSQAAQQDQEMEKTGMCVRLTHDDTDGLNVWQTVVKIISSLTVFPLFSKSGVYLH